MEWRRLHNENLSALYSSPSTMRAIKSRLIRWAGYVARMEYRRGAWRLVERDHSEDLDIDGRKY